MHQKKISSILYQQKFCQDFEKSVSLWSSSIYSPIRTFLTLDHKIIRVVWHLTLAKHSNPVGHEAACRWFILKAAEEILSIDRIKLCISPEAVDIALPLDRVSALYIIVVREEDLLGTVKRTPPTNGLLRPIIPSDSYSHICASRSCCLNCLNSCHIGWLWCIICSH